MRLFGDPLENLWTACIFNFCGVEKVARRNFESIVLSTPDQHPRLARRGPRDDAASFPAGGVIPRPYLPTSRRFLPSVRYYHFVPGNTGVEKRPMLGTGFASERQLSQGAGVRGPLASQRGRRKSLLFQA